MNHILFSYFILILSKTDFDFHRKKRLNNGNYLIMTTQGIYLYKENFSSKISGYTGQDYGSVAQYLYLITGVLRFSHHLVLGNESLQLVQINVCSASSWTSHISQ